MPHGCRCSERCPSRDASRDWTYPASVDTRLGLLELPRFRRHPGEVAKRNRNAELDGRSGRVVWHLILSGETAAAGLLIDA